MLKISQGNVLLAILTLQKNEEDPTIRSRVMKGNVSTVPTPFLYIYIYIYIYICADVNGRGSMGKTARALKIGTQVKEVRAMMHELADIGYLTSFKSNKSIIGIVNVTLNTSRPRSATKPSEMNSTGAKTPKRTSEVIDLLVK